MKSHTLNGAYIQRLFRTATSQGKDAVLVIRFEEVGLEVEATIKVTEVK